MAGEFDVYFSGECLEGFEPDDVRAGIARTFKLADDAANKLMNGEQHRIKGGCDKATALRYREAMAAIGANVSISRRDAAPAAVVSDSTEATTATEAHDHRNAKALVDGPADFSAGQSSVPHDVGTMAETTDGEIPWQAPEHAEPEPEPEMSLAPVGAILGSTEEDSYALVSVPEYDVSEAGEVIPTLPDEREPLNPNTDHLRMEQDDGH